MNIVATLGRVRAQIGWLPPLLLRVVLGVTFVKTGWGKLSDLDRVRQYFESLGIPAAGIQAPLVAGVELIGGLLLLLGLGTRIAAAMLAGVMAVAIVTAIWPASDGVVALLGSLEAIYLVTFVHLAVHGAGDVSIDHVISEGAIR